METGTSLKELFGDSSSDEDDVDMGMAAGAADGGGAGSMGATEEAADDGERGADFGDADDQRERSVSGEQPRRREPARPRRSITISKVPMPSNPRQVTAQTPPSPAGRSPPPFV